MNSDLEKKFDEQMENWVLFQKKNDQMLEDLKAGKYIPADIKEQIDKLNTSIDTLQKESEGIKVALNRAPSPDSEKEANEMKRDSMRAYFLKDHRGMTQDQVKSLSASTDGEGGYFVRPEFSTQINAKIFETSPIRQHATVLQIKTSVWEEIADYDEPDASWAGEKSTRSETDNNDIKMLRIPTHELTASPKATQTQLEDSILDVEAWHARKVEGKFARSEATGFATGDGVTRPRGIATYTNGTGFDQVEQVNSTSDGAFVGDGLIDVQTALFEEFQANARWMMKRASAGSIRKLKDGQGRYIWSVDKGLNNESLNFLLGKPVHFASDVAAIASNALAAYYGDFSGYYIMDRVGISVLRDPFSDKPFVVFYTRKRVGGGMRDFQKMKIQKLAV